MLRNNLYLALIHHPVVNKTGDIIASALTTIDMHDIARAAVTFGVRGFYVVTPLDDQKVLAGEVIAHWTKGVGGRLNPHRKEALELIRVVSSFEEAVEEIKLERKEPVRAIATSAADHDGSITAAELSQRMDSDTSYCLAFGTAWGLSKTFVDGCDYILDPIRGLNGYNHLSVRSAVSIILDRVTINGRK